jgi:hypothetical protein
MKKFLLTIAIALFFIESFSQQVNPAPSLTKQDYLDKSRKQKTAAWILLGGGAALIITGTILSANEVEEDYQNDPYNPFAPLTEADFDGPEWVFTTGIFAGLGSIPLFVASSRNRRKAMTVSLKNEQFQSLKNSSLVYKPMPAVSLKINL